MHLGEVYRWNTAKAMGHAARLKMHVYVGESTDWRDEGQAFLFISSANYLSDFPLAAADYPAILEHDSHISCSGLVFYSDAELATAAPELLGQVGQHHLAALRQAVANSETMEGWQIAFVCAAIDAALA